MVKNLYKYLYKKYEESGNMEKIVILLCNINKK